jgi:cytidine deaminase
MIDQAFVDEVVAFATERFPFDEAIGAVKTSTGRVLTSVHFEAVVDTAHLCAETGAICEARKLREDVVASICIYRDTADEPFRVIPPCGICQERLLVWGRDVQVAVPGRDGRMWDARPLRDLHPYDWDEVFGNA